MICPNCKRDTDKLVKCKYCGLEMCDKCAAFMSSDGLIACPNCAEEALNEFFGKHPE